MKTITKNLIRILILIIPLLFLSACEDYDTELLEIAFEAWAEENGLYIDGEWQPDDVVIIVLKNTVDNITNTDTKVQFDAAEDVLRDIEKANNLASEAMDTLDTAKMASALSLRPLDWRLHEQDGALWLASDNSSAAQTAFTQSDELLRHNLEIGGDCVALRHIQLATRMEALNNAIDAGDAKAGDDGVLTGVIYDEYVKVQAELANIEHDRSSAFCEAIGY